MHQTPLGEFTALPHIPQLDLRGSTSIGKGREGLVNGRGMGRIAKERTGGRREGRGGEGKGRLSK